MRTMSPKKMAWREKQRAKGKMLWVLQTGAIWAVAMMVSMFLAGLFLKTNQSFDFFAIPIWIIGGILVGWIGWNANEGNYQATLLEKRLVDPLNNVSIHQ